MAKRTAIYPGSFDPITNGHLDIIERGRRLFDQVVIAVLENPGKTAVFPLAERLESIRRAVAGWEDVQVDTFHGLLVDYVEARRAAVILRGIRAVSDFESEFQMAMMNRRLGPAVETVFLMPGEAFFFLSSHLVREVASLGGDVSGLVPAPVRGMLARRYGAPAGGGER